MPKVLESSATARTVEIDSDAIGETRSECYVSLFKPINPNPKGHKPKMFVPAFTQSSAPV